MNVQRRWIYVCAGLLGINALVMVVLVTASAWSAPAVVPRYYEQAVGWDKEQAAVRAADELGWTVSCELSAAGARLRMRDGAGQPVAGARITLTGFHRGYPARRAELEVVTDAAGEALGVPRDGAAPWQPTTGWYELELRVHRGDLGYAVRRAVELPAGAAGGGR
jgi:hypothetical protein